MRGRIRSGRCTSSELLLKICLLQKEGASFHHDLFICWATHCYCSSFKWKYTPKYLVFPQASFIPEAFCFTWRMLNFASFPHSLFSVVLTGISYILRLSENTGDCWEPCWPGCLPENILLNTEITASKMIAANPYPFVLAETLKCPGGIYCI